MSCIKLPPLELSAFVAILLCSHTDDMTAQCQYNSLPNTSMHVPNTSMHVCIQHTSSVKWQSTLANIRPRPNSHPSIVEEEEKEEEEKEEEENPGHPSIVHSSTKDILCGFLPLATQLFPENHLPWHLSSSQYNTVFPSHLQIQSTI